MRRLVLGLFLLTGCGTVVPAQTASTVPAGSYRVSGQLSQSLWCGVLFNGCAAWPEDALPTPELRANLRRGLVPGLDVGASGFMTGYLERGLRVGTFVDGKVELWERTPEPGTRQLLSVGLGAGGSFNHVNRRGGYWEADLALPVFFGQQTASSETVVGVRMLERLNFRTIEGSSFHHYPALGALVAIFSRGDPGFGVQFSYDAPIGFLEQGSWTLSGTVHPDFGG